MINRMIFAIIAATNRAAILKFLAIADIILTLTVSSILGRKTHTMNAGPVEIIESVIFTRVTTLGWTAILSKDMSMHSSCLLANIIGVPSIVCNYLTHFVHAVLLKVVGCENLARSSASHGAALSR
jgi:hypothetical protein